MISEISEERLYPEWNGVAELRPLPLLRHNRIFYGQNPLDTQNPSSYTTTVKNNVLSI